MTRIEEMSERRGIAAAKCINGGRSSGAPGADMPRGDPRARISGPLSAGQNDRSAAAGDRDRRGRRAAGARENAPEAAECQEPVIHGSNSVEIVDRSGVDRSPG